MNGKSVLLLLALLFGFACSSKEERDAVAKFEQWAHSQPQQVVKPEDAVYAVLVNGLTVNISRIPLQEEKDHFILIEDEIPNPGSEEFWCYPGGVYVTSIDEAAEFLRKKFQERN